jgi:phage FluMu protein gp41
MVANVGATNPTRVHESLTKVETRNSLTLSCLEQLGVALLRCQCDLVGKVPAPAVGLSWAGSG